MVLELEDRVVLLALADDDDRSIERIVLAEGLIDLIALDSVDRDRAVGEKFPRLALAGSYLAFDQRIDKSDAFGDIAARRIGKCGSYFLNAEILNVSLKQGFSDL